MEELESVFTLADGRTVLIRLEDCADGASAFDGGREIGRIEFDEDSLLVHAEVDAGYQRMGIAMEALRRLSETFGQTYYAFPPDGRRYDDARHLSSEGAAFANRAVARGYMRWIDLDAQ